MAEKLPSLGGIVHDIREYSQKSSKHHPFGLFSEQIFGPVNSLKCQCGKLNGPINENKICDKCNVLCTSEDLRYSTFGEILTIFPFVNPSKKTKLIKMLGKLSNVLINPDRNDLNLDNVRYIAIKNDKTSIQLVDGNISNYSLIPFRITGIYSLYIVLKYLKERLQIESAIKILDEKYIRFDLKVIPPSLRMYSFDTETKSIRLPPINKHYITILNSNKANLPYYEIIKQDEEEWLTKIDIILEDNIDNQDIIESGMNIYDTQSSYYQRAVNNIYNEIYKTLSGKEGLIRNMILGRTIDFSSRAVITVDPSILPYQIKVSKKILRIVWAPYFVHWLTNYKDLDFTYCFDKYLLNEVNNTREIDPLFDEFLEWFYKDYED